jgi:sigma-B regulation protein RsbU (phosphoserine phosphatase)
MSAGFYIMAVALAAWQRGLSAGVAIALAATGLDIAADWFHPANPLARNFLVVNWGLGSLVLLGTAWLGATAGRQQRELAEQRDQLASFSAHMEEDMRQARVLQELLSGAAPEVPGLEIGTYLQPARILGGDAVDLALSPDGRLAVMVADVSGKGSPAALAGAVLIGMLDDAPDRFRSPAGALRFLNRRLAERLPDTMFVTMFYALLDPAAGRLTYAGAGHDPPLLVRGAPAPAELLPTGMALGLLPDSEYAERTLLLDPGDLLLCYTDGLTDVQDLDGRRLGAEGLKAHVARLSGRPAREATALLVRDVISEAASVPDDISLVAVSYSGAPLTSGGSR